MVTRGERWRRIAFAAILALCLLHGIHYIARTSFLLGGERYFVLFDDEMVSMRYASNLASGRGLVWNPGGERVEGFTNPLWTLAMAAIHLLPVAASRISVVVQALGLLLLLANLFLVRGLAREVTGSEAAALVAALLTAAYFPLAAWALQGTEMGLLAAWVTGCAWLTLRCGRKPGHELPLWLLLGAGTLIRLDAAIPALAMAALVGTTGKNRPRKAATGIAIVAGFLLAQTAARYGYYGETLPNAYYLKLAGFTANARLSLGLAALGAFVASSFGVAALPVAVLAYRRGRAILALAAVALFQAAYSVYVGGDSWEWYGGSNRFLSIAMPLLFVLLAVLLLDGLAVAARRLPRGATATAGTLAVAAALFLLNYHGGPAATVSRWAAVERPIYFDENRRLVETALRLASITRDDATLAVTWAGTVPYFSRRTCVDLLGANDKTIARGPMRVQSGSDALTGFTPGPAKWNFRHSIVDLEPDVIVHTWEGMEPLEGRAPYFAYDLDMLGAVYLRKGSTRLALDPATLAASETWSQGKVLEAAGRIDDALPRYRDAIARGPYNERWRYHLGELLVERRPLEEVEAYYAAATAGDSKPQTSYYFLGLALARAKRFDEAAARFAHAIEIDPGHEMSHFAWGRMLASQGRLDEAVAHLREAVAIFPDFAAAHRELAATLRRLGREGEASREDAAAQDSDPATPRRFLYWGRYLLAKGHAAKALPELEKAIRADPDDREARDLLEKARGAARM